MRLRITFSKTGALRYIGHLDLHRVWERTIRRAGLSLAYTQGFHPGPRIQIAAALPLGFSGLAEVVDVWLNDNPADMRTATQRERIQTAAPPGLILLNVEPVDERGPTLQTQVTAAEYEVTLLETQAGSDIQAKVARLLESRTLPRERRGKTYDLRPLILSLEALEGSLRMQLVAREGATGRPEEVLAELGVPLDSTRIARTCLLFKSGSK